MIRLPSGREPVHIFPHSFLFHILFVLCVYSAILQWAVLVCQNCPLVLFQHRHCLSASLQSITQWLAGKAFLLFSSRHVVHQHQQLAGLQLWQPLSTFHTRSRESLVAEGSASWRGPAGCVWQEKGTALMDVVANWDFTSSPWGFTLLLVLTSLSKSISSRM